MLDFNIVPSKKSFLILSPILPHNNIFSFLVQSIRDNFPLNIIHPFSTFVDSSIINQRIAHDALHLRSMPEVGPEPVNGSSVSTDPEPRQR